MKGVTLLRSCEWCKARLGTKADFVTLVVVVRGKKERRFTCGEKYQCLTNYLVSPQAQKYLEGIL